MALRDKNTMVDELMQKLQRDQSTTDLTDAKRWNILEQLKVYGRDPSNSAAIYTDAGLHTLCHYAFGTHAVNVSLEATKCIANALLLRPEFRAKIVALDHVDSIAEMYRRQDNESEFLAARILFLLTYNTKADFAELVQSHDLAEDIRKHLGRHAERLTSTRQSSDQMDTMALQETLKLLFNLANQLPSEHVSLSAAVPAISTMLNHIETTMPPLDGLLAAMINALAILDFETISTPSGMQSAHRQYVELVPKLVEILEASIKQYKPLQLDTIAIPLVTVLHKVYDQSTADLKLTMQKTLLPDDNDRGLPLGRSSSLSSQLLQLTVSPGLTNLPEALSALFFEMSDQNASKFVNNIGYGHAAGYLMTHKIPFPEGVAHAGSDPVSNQMPINPITGQRLDKEETSNMPEMTAEEKEREAERLFVLFERLKATGVMDVTSPLRQAQEAGELEKPKDSDSDPD